MGKSGNFLRFNEGRLEVEEVVVLLLVSLSEGDNGVFKSKITVDAVEEAIDAWPLVVLRTGSLKSALGEVEEVEVEFELDVLRRERNGIWSLGEVEGDVGFDLDSLRREGNESLISIPSVESLGEIVLALDGFCNRGEERGLVWDVREDVVFVFLENFFLSVDSFSFVGNSESVSFMAIAEEHSRNVKKAVPRIGRGILIIFILLISHSLP